MYHQREKYHIITITSLALAIIFTFIALFKSVYFFLFLALYLLITSVMSDAIFLYFTFQKYHSLKQFVRGITLLLIVTFLLLRLLRS